MKLLETVPDDFHTAITPSVMNLVRPAFDDAAVGLVVDDLRELCVAEHAAAEEAGLAARERAVGVDADDVDRRTVHGGWVGVDDGVLFGVDGDAELVVPAFRDVQALALADAGIDAVGFAARCAVVARADDDVVFDDDGAVAAAQAGRAAADSTRDVKEVCRPVRTVLGIAHGVVPPLLAPAEAASCCLL